MRQIRIAKRRPNPARGRQPPLPVDPGDLDIVHVHRAAGRTGDTHADRNQPGRRASTKPGPGENSTDLRTSCEPSRGNRRGPAAPHPPPIGAPSPLTQPVDQRLHHALKRHGCGRPQQRRNRVPGPGRVRSSAGLMALSVVTSGCRLLPELYRGYCAPGATAGICRYGSRISGPEH